jgi:galactokinase
LLGECTIDAGKNVKRCCVLLKEFAGYPSLTGLNMERPEEYRGLLSQVAYKRAHHVITENARVLDGMDGLRMGRLHQFGEYVSKSHGGLRDMFEVSFADLDLMVELANQQAGVNGARMTGGGFGGATINLVEASSAEAFAESAANVYQKEASLVPTSYICMPDGGLLE